ncbi:hypothetical protein NDU88_012017 [Pleurodeles waltl]|uniref:Uncharacterized protein n=1 Tax=Pleurodeles waltl TaxID=8319 RepID=A0AAV7R0A5_PLEWA|nr:hypothetical protein NDU88_012017 [Pleurodeles waltl]
MHQGGLRPRAELRPPMSAQPSPTQGERKELGDSVPRKCGVALELRKTIPLTVIKSWADSEGYYVFTTLKMGDSSLCVGSVYAPIGSKRLFFLKINCILAEIGATRCVIEGDWY